MTSAWKKWNPGLENDDLTLGEVRETLPGNPPEDINMLVRILENPSSPIALPGAVTLENHDCIHVLLGRGLLNQDEAFVIGYTMGTSKNLSKLQEYIFKKVAAHLYPRVYRFNKNHLKAYDIGLEEGKRCRVEKIYEFPFAEYYDWTLGDLREKIGVNKTKLYEAFRREKELLPHTVASKRLFIP